MREGAVYLGASLCLGWIAVWAGENLFWTTPAPDLGLVELALTWLTYSMVAGAALSAVIWARLEGWRAAFLGGALLGFGIEGAVVGTMYQAFPVQLVWTPLTWHALISGLCVLGGGFALARGGVTAQVAGLAALGLFGAVWGLYWPLEGKVLAGWTRMALYLGLCGAGVALALGLLSRLGPMPRGRWWLWVAPAAVAVLWGVGTALTPVPLRLAGPVMVGLTLWAMRRLGGGMDGAGAVDFGPPLPWTRCALFLIAPGVTVGLVVPGWVVLGGVGVNIPVAVATGVVGAALWLWLLWRAARR